MTIYKFKKDPFSSHKRMADCIFDEKCQSILDVGCNRGQLLKALDDWKGEIWGIDKNEEVLNVVKDKYSKVILMDVCREGFHHQKKFDAIVFGDILEHTEEPEKVVKNFLPNLAKNGIVIISVPNVANWIIRLLLLVGKFDYTSSGILDGTHLKFFTLNSAKKMLDRCGLKIERIKATPVPLPLVIKSTDLGRPLFLLHVLNYTITKLRKSFFGYQFIIKCRLK